MKIAMMTNNYKPFIGGVPVSVERLSGDIRNLGYNVTVFAPSYKAQVAEEHVMRYGSFMEGIYGGIVVPNFLDRKIEKVFIEENFDIIHVHHPVMIGRTAQLLSKKYNIPLVFTYHTRYEQYLHYFKPIHLLERGAIKNGKIHQTQRNLLHKIKNKAVPNYLHNFIKSCSHIFAPTQSIKEYLQKTFQVDDLNTSILPTGLSRYSFGEGVTRRKIEMLRKRYDAKNIPLFCCVARIAKEKNIPFLLSALARYREQYQRPFKMLLIGDGPDRAVYEKMCVDLNLQKEVIFTGKIPNHDLTTYYKAADLFLFASKTETQGMVITEAMAAGTPVVAIDASGVSDIVRNGQNGYLTAENEDDFSGHMDQIMTKPMLHQQLSHGAVDTAQAYSGESVAQRAVQVYKTVVSLSLF
jgi:glycosyltransferase involved in cell wall biosynthesis